jgi:hypothetical protein
MSRRTLISRRIWSINSSLLPIPEAGIVWPCHFQLLPRYLLLPAPHVCHPHRQACEPCHYTDRGPQVDLLWLAKPTRVKAENAIGRRKAKRVETVSSRSSVDMDDGMDGVNPVTDTFGTALWSFFEYSTRLLWLCIICNSISRTTVCCSLYVLYGVLVIAAEQT